MGFPFTRLVARQNSTPTSEFTNAAVFDGHLRVYPTLRCNLRCSYCVNEQMGARPQKFPETTPVQWIQALNREKRHVVFTGGEPFLYQGLIQVINNIAPELKVRVYSNFSLDVRPHLDSLRRPMHFYLSWHPQRKTGRALFLDNVLHMQKNPLFTADIHALAAEENCHRLEQDIEFFRRNGLTVQRDSDQRDFIGCGRPNVAKAVCSKTIYLIAPDGSRFQCVSRLVRDDRPMENILHESLGPEEALDICPDFGNCAPCDGLGQTKMAIFNRD